MKKRLFILAIIFSSFFALSAQESVSGEAKKSPLSSIDFLFEFSPAVYINPESSLVSAPSPVIYPIGFGVLWPNYTTFAIQPTISFFTMYHLWYDGMALPAEIENRTSQTISLLLNLPAVFSIFQGEKSRFQLYAGAAVLMRFGMLANGVKESDSGYTGTAGDDMTEINSWFWQNGRFLYASLGGSWLYSFGKRFRAGPTVYAYFPLGSLISGEGAQAMIISAGLKLCF